jgi:hypothetical protein
MSCCNLLASVRRLSSNSQVERMSFAQVPRVFIVEHCLASSYCLSCQDEFRDTYSDFFAKSTVSRLVNRFRGTGRLQDRNRFGRPSVLGYGSSDGIRQTALSFRRNSRNITFFYFIVIYFVTERVRNGLRDFSMNLSFANSDCGVNMRTCRYP